MYQVWVTICDHSPKKGLIWIFEVHVHVPMYMYLHVQYVHVHVFWMYMYMCIYFACYKFSNTHHVFEIKTAKRNQTIHGSNTRGCVFEIFNRLIFNTRKFS